MKPTILWTVIAVALSLSAADRIRETKLQQAIDLMGTKGDLAGAVKLLEEVAKSPDRNLAARSLIYLGDCREKLGQQESRKPYERIIRDFPDQKEVVAEAQRRLLALELAGGIGHSTGITLRKVSWDAREVSPSPDGRYFSFTDWKTGDLAVRDLVTEQSRRLTNTAKTGEWAEASVISGDGRQIAYAWYNQERYYELRVCGIDGSNPRTVYRDKEFGDWLEPYQWTADGKQILAALMKREPKVNRIALIPVAGGPARILPTRALKPWYPSLSPDGRFVVYSSGTPADQVFVLSLEKGQEDVLVRPEYDGWGPVWMPDGKKVLFISDRTGSNGLWTIEVEEGKPRGVPHLVKDGLGLDIRLNGFTRQGAFYFSTTSIPEVYIAELDLLAGKVAREPVPAIKRLAISSRAPAWSPDGRRLAYYSQREFGEAPKLMILSIETGETREIPVKLEQVHYPVRWFPDGKSVVVGAFESPGSDLVAFYRVDLQTGDHRLIRSSVGPGVARSELSPDGKTHFFYTSGEPKLKGGIISRDIAAGKEREIARVPTPASGFTRLAISPDGKYLAFRSPVDERQWTALRLVPATGGEVREVFRFPQAETIGNDELAWTPDARNLLFVRRTGMDGIPELWRITIAGGEPQRTGLSMEGMGFFAFHPDGRRIAFERSQGPPNQLWVLENIPAAKERLP